jgi:transglutaminase-like putative cysteine protease
MNRFHLMHVTEFAYDGPVSESYNELRLKPIHDERQSCLSFRIITTPHTNGTAYRDSYGNSVYQFNLLQEHRRLRIEAESIVLTHEIPEPTCPAMRLADLDSQEGDLREDYFDFIAPTGYVPHLPELRRFIEAAEEVSGGCVITFVRKVSRLIHDCFRYLPGATHVHSSIADSLSISAGVCQDFAHLLLGAVRMRGLPARYVSGYLVPERTASAESRQEEVIGGQASHAWTEVLIPGSGWLGADPTLGAPVGLRHVRLAYGRDYGDVAPVRGVYKGHAGQRLSVDVRVRPALDGEGHEQLAKTAAVPVAAPVMERAQQPAQQQQQQQQ